MQTITIPHIVAGTFALAVFVILGSWALGAFEGLGAGGAVALIFGIMVSAGVGIGLMAAVFYSNRAHDETVHNAAKGQFRS
jgi:hypothetical protein